MNITREQYGNTLEGKNVERFVLSNSTGITVSAITYGCIITSVKMPDREGSIAEVTLGFDSLDGYLAGHPYFGALVGRFANRIAAGRFELDGKPYSLARNIDGKNHLHGGTVGFDKKIWAAEEIEKSDRVGVVFSYTSPDGEEGYPGNLEVTVTYTLSEAGELSFEYRAETDKATPINLTNHTYWNFAAAGSGKIYDHRLTLHCSRYLPVNDDLLPTGEVLPVQGTPLDFSTEKAIGRDIGKLSLGYDHCFVADKQPGTMAAIARLHEPTSGRGMVLSTSKPAVQLYTGNFLDGIKGAGGAVFDKHTALCLETEFYPDAPNQPAFPSAVLRPGALYHHTTTQSLFVE